MNRSFSQQDVDKLLKIKTDNNALVTLTFRINNAMRLFHHATKSDDDTVSTEASKHCIVSIISGLEVFCKELILEYSNKWNSQGFSELLKDKITLHEAYNLFKELEVTREAIITHYYTFQSIENIASVFNALTTKDFLSQIENTKIYDDSQARLIDLLSDWRNELISLFKLRHRIIHENHTDLEVDDRSIIFLSGFIYSICLAMVRYCNENSFT